MSKQKRSGQVKSKLLSEVFWRSSSPVRTVAREFGLSRQAVQQHAKRLVDSGDLKASGGGRWRQYSLTRKSDERRTFELTKALTEDLVWDSFLTQHIPKISQDELDILRYGSSEIINNAIDHSGGSKITTRIWTTAASIGVMVEDDGIGIFQKIASALQLTDPRQSLLELGKGKFTTDPSRHTGEGIFFTSRAFDRFSLRSSNLLFFRTTRSDDWLVDVEDNTFSGTRATMGLLLPSIHKLQDIFGRFSSGPDDYKFAKTHVPLKLATFGDESLVSRSSARRVLARVDRFSEVILDFRGVRSIGPAFADEIFRVFSRQHPKVELISINANEQVTIMIRRAQSEHEEQQAGLFDKPPTT
jgi:anti-sigma regulatory factor (Ser/Thr protein kinase)